MEIFKELVDEYIETGNPVGSKTLSERIEHALSPATIRKVMADLEDIGILCSEHTSSGRMPTSKGWRYFVNSFVEISQTVEESDAHFVNVESSVTGKNVNGILENISETLSNLTNYASIIVTSTVNDKIIKHIDFVLLSQGRGLVVLVFDDGVVENRLISLPNTITSEVLEIASKYLNDRLCDKSLPEVKTMLDKEFDMCKTGIDDAVNAAIARGMDAWVSDNDYGERIIVKGQSNLLSSESDISCIQSLLRKLDEKNTIRTLLNEVIDGKGIQVFIGSENKAFDISGCSMIIAPYKDHKKRVIGAIGVIGPERMRYSRVINLVDCTARVIEKMMLQK